MLGEFLLVEMFSPRGVSLNVVRFEIKTHIIFSAIKHPMFNRTLLNIFDIPFLEVFTPKVDIWFMLILYCMHMSPWVMVTLTLLRSHDILNYVLW